MDSEKFKTIIELCRNATKVVFNGGNLSEIPSTFEFSDSLEYKIRTICFSTTSETTFYHNNESNMKRLIECAKNNPKLPNNLFDNISQ